LGAGVAGGSASHARAQPLQLRRTFAGALDRLAGDVQRMTFGIRQRLGELRGVVALAATDVQPALRRAFGGQLGQAPGQRCIVAAIEKAPAGLDHGLVVAGGAAVLVLHRQQVQIALARTIETVVGRAGDTVFDRAQRRLADRADQHASRFTRVW